jgi:hypothetical protein
MYAGPDRCRFAFFLDVVAAISDESPSMAIGHHVGPKVAAIGAAKRDGAAVAIEGRGSLRRLHELLPEVHPSRPQAYSENGPRLVATDLIAASVMAAAFRAESGFSRRPLDPSAA